jgi:hypothetical protein
LDQEVDWQQALGNLVNVIAAVSFVASVVLYLNGEGRDAPSVTISIIALVLFAGLLYWIYRTARRERYANVMRLLETIADQCRTSRQRLVDSKDPTAPNSQLKMDLSIILTDVAMLFSIVTGTQCRAAVKLLGDVDEDDDGNLDEPWVFTLARDRTSAGTYKLSDQQREFAKFDKISMNPHLADLFGWKDGEDYQCYNDLRRMIRDGGYSSTTIVWALSEPESAASRPDRRPLPYASAMIALVQAQDDSHIGFLGVDSDKARAFRETWDGPLLVAVANMIGTLLQDIPFADDGEDENGGASQEVPGKVV